MLSQTLSTAQARGAAHDGRVIRVLVTVAYAICEVILSGRSILIGTAGLWSHFSCFFTCWMRTSAPSLPLFSHSASAQTGLSGRYGFARMTGVCHERFSIGTIGVDVVGVGSIGMCSRAVLPTVN